jgi:hypothetical protein
MTPTARQAATSSDDRVQRVPDLAVRLMHQSRPLHRVYPPGSFGSNCLDSSGSVWALTRREKTSCAECPAAVSACGQVGLFLTTLEGRAVGIAAIRQH